MDADEMIIENKYKVTKDLFIKWAKENKKVVYFRIFWIIVAIYCIGMAIYSIISNNIYDSIIFFLFAFYASFVRIVVRKFGVVRRYEALEKLYKQSDWERRIIFFDDYAKTIDADMNHMKFQYQDILNIEKDDECIKLKMNIGYIRIYKNAFVRSNFEECEKFLMEKMKRGKIMNEEKIYIPKDVTELINKMKENEFKGEITLQGGIIYWQIDDRKNIQIIFENQPDEAYIILPSEVQDHVPHDELWEYLDSLNNSNGEF